MLTTQSIYSGDNFTKMFAVIVIIPSIQTGATAKLFQRLVVMETEMNQHSCFIHQGKVKLGKALMCIQCTPYMCNDVILKKT